MANSPERDAGRPHGANGGPPSWTFNGSGYETQWQSADGKETLLYRYDGSNRLSGVTAIDGALATLSYTATSVTNNVTIQATNGTTTLTLSSGDLATAKNPDGGLDTFTYDGSHRLTRQQIGGLENNWAYSSAGTVGTYTWGVTSLNSVTNLSRTTYQPALTRGLGTTVFMGTVSGTPVSGTVWASPTDADGHTEQMQLDAVGRTLADVQPDGAWTTYSYSSGYLASQTDPLAGPPATRGTPPAT